MKKPDSEVNMLSTSLFTRGFTESWDSWIPILIVVIGPILYKISRYSQYVYIIVFIDFDVFTSVNSPMN